MAITKPRILTKRCCLAAELVAEGELTNAEIAHRIGRTQSWLAEKKNDPVFKQRVGEIISAFQQAVVDQGIAVKAKRIHALNQRWLAGHEVIRQRAADDEWKDVPGWSTGLLVHNVKNVGGGENAERVDLFEVDTGLLAELRGMELQAARELGQLPEIEKKYGDINVLNNGGAVQIVRGGPLLDEPG